MIFAFHYKFVRKHKTLPVITLAGFFGKGFARRTDNILK